MPESIPLSQFGQTPISTPAVQQSQRGESIPISSFGISPLSPQGQELPQSPPDWLHYLTKAAGFALPMAGAALGSTIGPEGTIGGAVIGGQAGRALERYGEGKGPIGPLESVKNAVQDAVLGKAGEVAGEIASPVVGKLIKLFQSTPKQSATSEAIQKALELGVKSKEDIPEALARQATEVTGSPYQVPKTVTGTAGQEAVASNMAATAEARRALYKKFEDTHIGPNTQQFDKFEGMQTSPVAGPTGQPVVTPRISKVPIAGPIYTSNATTLAAQLKPILDDQIAGPEFTTLKPFVQASLKKAKAGIDNLVEGIPSLSASGEPVTIPVKPWDTVKQIRTDINRTVGGKVFPERGQAIAQNLAKALDDDINQSITTTWKNGPQALQDLNKADAAYTLERRTFPKEIVNKVFTKGNRFEPADASDFFDQAFKSPETTQRMMTALGPTNTGIAQTHYFENNLLPKGSASLKSAIQELEDPNSVSRTVFNASTRNGMLQTFRALASVPESEGQEMGRFAMGLKGGKMIFNLAKAPLNVAAGRPLSAAHNVSVAVDAFQVLKNAQVANAAARLAKIPPSSAEASSRTKLIFSALKGLPVSVTTDLGTTDGELTESGGIKTH